MGGPLRRTKIAEKAQATSEGTRWLEEHSVQRTDSTGEAFGFRLSRISGSHHIFVQPQVPELVNLQNVGGKAKPYQIRQFLKLVERYNLKLEDES